MENKTLEPESRVPSKRFLELLTQTKTKFKCVVNLRQHPLNCDEKILISLFENIMFFEVLVRVLFMCSLLRFSQASQMKTNLKIYVAYPQEAKKTLYLKYIIWLLQLSKLIKTKIVKKSMFSVSKNKTGNIRIRWNSKAWTNIIIKWLEHQINQSNQKFVWGSTGRSSQTNQFGNSPKKKYVKFLKSKKEPKIHMRGYLMEFAGTKKSIK
jgi:hypothetical protein